MRATVKVRVKDIRTLLDETDQTMLYSKQAWKARKRLLEATIGLEETAEATWEIDCICGTQRDCHTAGCARHNAKKRPNTELEDSMEFPANPMDYCSVPACGCSGDRSHP